MSVDFPKKLRELLSDQDLQQMDLAARAGVSSGSISRILRGVNIPRKATIEAIIQAFCKNESQRSGLRRAYRSWRDTQVEARRDRGAKDRIKGVSRTVDSDIDLLRMDVARDLEEAELPYEVRESDVDFLVTRTIRVAVRCEIGPESLTLEKIEEILGECERVHSARILIVCLPYTSRRTDPLRRTLAAQGASLVAFSDLIPSLVKILDEELIPLRVPARILGEIMRVARENEVEIDDLTKENIKLF